VGEEGLEGDGDDRGAERCADLLGDAGVHGGVRDACRLDVLVGDRHRRDQHRPDPQTKSTAPSHHKLVLGPASANGTRNSQRQLSQLRITPPIINVPVIASGSA
jgi:hypothetical protein